jgi:UDP-N-acetylmuramoyl-L-alanyl-D-glutamate--2,6-diaminopimelate ligase
MSFEKTISELNPISIKGEVPKKVTDIFYSSLNVKENSVFIAVTGFSIDGNRFVDDAISRGAVVIISEIDRPSNIKVCWIKVEDSRSAMAQVAASFWGVNFDNIFSTAITGTNGKTTVATIFNQLMQEVYGESYAWQFGTIGNYYGTLFEEATRTTPEAIDLLREIGTRAIKPKSLTMEASSHALVLERVKGFLFDVAIFTNLTQDHLDFHKTMDEYYSAKRELFINHLKNDGVAVINSDDEYGKKLAGELSNSITFGTNENSDFRILSAHCSWKSSVLNARFRGVKIKFEAPLVGKFNVSNMAAVATAALAKGVEVKAIQKVFSKLKPVAGRMEQVEVASSFPVIVDYAHTPDALKNVLTTARKLTKGRVIVVFGAGGDRDKTKRAPMAKMVAKNSDYAVITTDNPRTEDPIAILNRLEESMPLDFPKIVVEDRTLAIKTALKFARVDDVVIIAGKGHENYQEIDGVKHHFDDAEQVVKMWNEIEVSNES